MCSTNLGQSRSLFRLFLCSLHSNYKFNNINWKQPRWCTWDSNLGPQDETTELWRQQSWSFLIWIWSGFENLTKLKNFFSNLMNCWTLEAIRKFSLFSSLNVRMIELLKHFRWFQINFEIKALTLIVKFVK